MRELSIIEEIRGELKRRSEPLFKEQSQQFFKEQVKMFGVRTPAVREIAKGAFQKIRRMKKREIFALCGALLRSGQGEEVTIALDWAWRLRTHYDKRDVEVFENWLKRYVSNWAACDDLCTHPLGEILVQCSGEVARVRGWARSENRWVKRGAAVALIPGLRKGKFLAELFAVCDELMQDEDDLVRKGYGWALKEAGNANLKEVFQYVVRNKKKMSRVALRYAIEKMPHELRRNAMEK